MITDVFSVTKKMQAMMKLLQYWWNITITVRSDSASTNLGTGVYKSIQLKSSNRSPTDDGDDDIILTTELRRPVPNINAGKGDTHK